MIDILLLTLAVIAEQIAPTYHIDKLALDV